MGHSDLTGQVLDGKYQMIRELGSGGMGSVYLATHLGTERPVAVKIIAPQFMKRAEFIERFRREARAAGRLRHPNVVDVTDFGFAMMSGGEVAYLVMEYLDGCTLGEILEEERNLPVSWTLDILEQVSSAVNAAHEQGIIHRDLKPDNIWLEPNQRGGYTVKVLDFGIAKLEEHNSGTADTSLPGAEPAVSRPTQLIHNDAATVHGETGNDTRKGQNATIQLAPLADEGKTAIFENAAENEDTIGTIVLDSAEGDASEDASRPLTAHSLKDSPTTASLTRVGSVLGTPLYMSPEQCRGESLDTRSDVYSLGVIAYQMLSGKTPFEGKFDDVMEAHKALPPPRFSAKGVPRKLKNAILSALEKDPNMRPPTAEAFASILRSHSEGIFGLLRRSLVIYSEYLPKFLLAATLFSLPTIILTIATIVLAFLNVSGMILEATSNIAIGTLAGLLQVINLFCTYLLTGAIAWMVVQSIAMPLRPVRLRSALTEVRKRWKALAITGLLSTVWSLLIGVITCGIGFFVTSVIWTLVTPVVILEHIKGKAALKRSKDLVKRSLMTTAAAAFVMFLIPAIAGGTLSAIVDLAATGIEQKIERIDTSPDDTGNAPKAAAPADDKPEQPPAQDESGAKGIRITSKSGSGIRFTTDDSATRTKVERAVLQSFVQLIWLPMQIVILSFSSIIVALLYIKTRLAGGESWTDLIAQFEDDERPVKKWQERVRRRLIHSGTISSKP